MKKAIGFGLVLLTLIFVVGCKPTTKEVTTALGEAADVATLKSDVEDLSSQVADLQISVQDVITSLDSLTAAFEDHMKKFHTTTTKIPRVTKPTTGGGGPVRRPTR